MTANANNLCKPEGRRHNRPEDLQIQTEQDHLLQPSWTHRLLYASAAMLLVLLTAGCHHKAKVARRYPPPLPATSRGDGTASVGNRPLPSYATPPPNWNDNAISPGRTASVEEGLASWYGPPYHNQKAANGQVYNQNAMTAAHRTLPMGTRIRVTNVATNQSAEVVITDRGPFVHGRVIDLSLAAAKETGVYRAGIAKVRIEVLEERPGVSATGRWCVQIGAFANKNHALKLQQQLLRNYAQSKVIEFQGPTGHWVRINPVAGDRRRAQQIAQSIHTGDPAVVPYLVRLD